MTDSFDVKQGGEFEISFREEIRRTLYYWTESRRQFPDELHALFSRLAPVLQDVKFASTEFPQRMILLKKLFKEEIERMPDRLIDADDQLVHTLSLFLLQADEIGRQQLVGQLALIPSSLFSPDFLWTALPVTVFKHWSLLPDNYSPLRLSYARMYWRPVIQAWRDRLVNEPWKGPIPLSTALQELLRATGEGMSQAPAEYLPRGLPQYYEMQIRDEFHRVWREFFVIHDAPVISGLCAGLSECVGRSVVRRKAELHVPEVRLKIAGVEASTLWGPPKARAMDRLCFHVLNLQQLILKIDDDSTINLIKADAVLDKVSEFLMESDNPEYFHDEALFEGLVGPPAEKKDGSDGLTAELLEDLGLIDARRNGGKILAIVQLNCSAEAGVVPDLGSCEAELKKVFEGLHVTDRGRFKQFVRDLLMVELRGAFVVSKEVLVDKVMLAVYENGHVSDEEVKTAFRTATTQEAAIARGKKGEQVEIVDYVFERCMVGLWDLARKLGRPFSHEEGLLAVRQVELCMGDMFDSIVSFEKMDKLELRCPVWAPGDQETAVRWKSLWTQLLSAAAGRGPSSHETLRRAVLENLKNIPSFVFHSEWKPPVKAALSTAAMHAVVHILPLLDESRKGRSLTRATMPLLSCLEGGFGLFAQTDGMFAEALLQGQGAGYLMPSVDLIIDEIHHEVSVAAFNFEIPCPLYFARLSEGKGKMTNVLRRHLVNWKLLLKAGVVKEITRRLVLALLFDLRPWFSVLFKPTTKPEVRECFNYEKAYTDLERAVQTEMLNVFSGKSESLVVFLTKVLLCIARHPGLFDVPVEIWLEFPCVKASELLSAARPPIPGRSVALPVKKRKATKLGVLLAGDPDAFEMNFRAILQRGVVFWSKRIAVLAQEREQFQFTRGIGLYLFAPLQSLYVRYRVEPLQGNARWETFLTQISKQAVECLVAALPESLQCNESKRCELAVTLKYCCFNPQRFWETIYQQSTWLTDFLHEPDTPELFAADLISLRIDDIEALGSKFLEDVGVARFASSLRNVKRHGEPAFLDAWREGRAKYLYTVSPHPLSYWIRRIDLLLPYSDFGVDFLPSRDFFASSGKAGIPLTTSKNGFQGLEAIIDELTSSLAGLWRNVVASWDTSVSVPFEEALELVRATDEMVKVSGMRVVNHSGFVAMVRKTISSVVVDKFPEHAVETIGKHLSMLIGSIAIDNQKSKRKAECAAKGALGAWFVVADSPLASDRIAEQAVPDSTLTRGPLPASDYEIKPETPFQVSRSTKVCAVEEGRFEDETSGLAGQIESVLKFKEILPTVLTAAFGRMADALREKGAVSVGQLDHLKDTLNIELLDLGITIARTSQWNSYLGTELAQACGPLFVANAVWGCPLICTILTTESGSDRNAANARRLLSEDKRSPFSKNATAKQKDGTHKIRLDFTEDVSWNGVLLREAKIEEFRHRLGEGIAVLRSALSYRDEDGIPKSFDIVENFSDFVEVVRFLSDAVVDDSSALQSFLEESLVDAGVGKWNASAIARFACFQFIDCAEGAKEKAKVKELLLTDHQSDFASDPYAGWRPVITDGRFEVPQCPRIAYPLFGLSLQSAEQEDGKDSHGLSRGVLLIRSSGTFAV